MSRAQFFVMLVAATFAAFIVGAWIAFWLGLML